MQATFPEGYVFTWALFGLASAQSVEILPPGDPRRATALANSRKAVEEVDSPLARAPFEPHMAPAFGVFYAGWSLYLRSVVLRHTPAGDPPPFDLAAWERDADSLAAALDRFPTPFLESYPGMSWPADTVVGVAGLAIHDRLVTPCYGATISRWLADVRARCREPYYAVFHAVDAFDGTRISGPRGGSLALMSLLLVDIDSTFAREQYDVLRQQFATYAWGLPGVREYPHGVNGPGDIDSGPVILGFAGPATVVGAGAALANGDYALADALLKVPELIGVPIELAGHRRYALGLLPVGDAFLAWARTIRAPGVRTGYTHIVPTWWRLPIHGLSLLVAGVLVARTRSRSH